MKGVRGPTRHNVFEEQPNTSNAVYGFDVMREIRLKQAREAGKALACCKPIPMPQRVPCRLRPLADLIEVNPRSDFFIAEKLRKGWNKPYIPVPNQK